MYKLLFISIILAIGIGGVGHYSTGTQEYVLPEPKSIRVELTVPEKEYVVQVLEQSSVFEVMEQAKEQGLQFAGKEFGEIGFFVQEINGLRENPRQGKYWIYYINNKKATVGISAYNVHNNDVISFKYENEE
jgi:hypothetical protein